MNKKQKRRKLVLETQNSKCALCNRHICTEVDQACYYTPKKAVVCRVCNTSIHNYVKLTNEPGALDRMAAFLSQPPAPEPTLSRDNLITRLKAATDGPDTLAKVDAANGWSGPVLDPETREELHNTEQTPSDEQREHEERMMIDGVWCGADGEPLE